MRIALLAAPPAFRQLSSLAPGIDWVAYDPAHQEEVDAYIIISEDPDVLRAVKTGKPLLLGSLLHRLSENEFPAQAVRFCGWENFLPHTTWEVAGEIDEPTAAVFTALERATVKSPDNIGLIAPRVLAMIINEAFYALGENVASKADIDTAMKLGTNYPEGPFAWCELIGGAHIKALLESLAAEDELYAPAPELIKQYSN